MTGHEVLGSLAYIRERIHGSSKVLPPPKRNQGRRNRARWRKGNSGWLSPRTTQLVPPPHLPSPPPHHRIRLLLIFILLLHRLLCPLQLLFLLLTEAKVPLLILCSFCLSPSFRIFSPTFNSSSSSSLYLNFPLCLSSSFLIFSQTFNSSSSSSPYLKFPFRSQVLRFLSLIFILLLHRPLSTHTIFFVFLLLTVS